MVGARVLASFKTCLLLAPGKNRPKRPSFHKAASRRLMARAVSNGVALPKTSPREYSQRSARPPRCILGIADRYLFWQMVSATLRGLIWFGGLLVLVSTINVLRKGLQQSLPLDAMLMALLYQLPRVFQFAMPMSLMFGTVQTFSELSARGEITALWAGGMGLKRMLRAPLLWGALLGFTSFLVQEYIVPDSEFRSARVFEDRVKVALKTQSNFRYFDPPPGKGALKLQILANRYDAKTGALIDPRVTIYYPDGSQKTTIDAERGWGDEKTGLWKFSNGLIRFFPKAKVKIRVRSARATSNVLPRFKTISMVTAR